MDRENVYKSLIDNSPSGFAYHKLIVDKNNKPIDYEFLEVNQTFCDILGKQAQDIVNKKVTEVIPSIREDSFDWIQYYGEIALKPCHREIEQYSRVLDKHFSIITYSPEKFYFVTIFKDITVTKKNEKKINAQIELINHIMNAFNHPFYILDANNYSIIMSNKLIPVDNETEAIKCYQLSHHIDHPCRIEDGHTCPLIVVKQTGKPHNVEHIHYDKNNKPRNVRVYAYPIYNHEGYVDRIIEYSLDITDLKQSMEELKKYSMELQDKNNQLKKIAFAASHNLREPIRMIISYIQLIDRNLHQNLDESTQEYMNYAMDGAKRMNSMILSLLDYSLLDINISEFETIHTNKIINKVLNQIDDTIRKSKATIHVDELPHFLGNPQQIQILFKHLISNAIIYNKPEHKPVISIKANKLDNNELEFIISDNGIGIEKEYHEQVFELFYRLHTYEEFHGAGLGLSICQNIIYNHFGKIWLDSEKEKGTSVHFVIPQKIDMSNLDYGRYIGYTKDLIERKKTNRNLKEIKEQLQFAIEGSDLGLWDWNFQTNEVYFSKGWKSMLGYEEHEFENNFQAWENHIHPHDLEKVRQTLSDLMNDKIPILILEHRLKCKDGTYKWIQGRGKIISRTEDGKPLRVIGTHTDITSQKNIEISLKKSEANFRSYFDNAPYGIFIVDDKGNYISVNQAACDLYGYSREELLHMNISDISHPDTNEIGLKHFRNLKTEGKAQSKIKIKKKDGSTIYIELNAVKLDDNRYMGFNTNITHRMRNQSIYATLIELIEYSQEHNINEFLRKLLDKVEELTESRIAFYHFVEEDQVTLKLQTWSTNTTNNLCKAEGEGLHYPISQAGIWVDCVRYKKPVIHNDYASLPHKKGLPLGHVPIVRDMEVPVMRGNKVLAILGVGNKKTDYNEDDLELTQRLAEIAWEMVDRKLSNIALLKNEERLKKAQKIAKIGNWDLDIQTDTLIWSDEVYRIFNLKPQDFNETYEAFINLVHPEDREMLDTLYKHSVMNHELYDFTHRLLMNDGSLKFVHERGETYYDENDTPIRTIGTIHDITYLTETEIALRYSEERLRTLINASPDVICFKDGKGRWMEANKAGLDLFMLDMNNYRGKTDAELAEHVHPIYKQALLTCEMSDEKAWEAKEGFIRTEEITPLPDGSARILDVIKVPLFHRNGERKALVILGRDITDLMHTQNALFESQQRWQFAIEGSNLGIWDWNVQTGEVFFSKRWKSMLGYKDIEIEGKYEEWESRLHQYDKPRCLQTLNDYISGKLDTFALEHRLRCKDGSYKWIVARGKIITYTEDKKPLRFIGTHDDISEQKEHERTIAEKNRSLENAERIAHVGNWVWHIDTNEIKWSNELCRIYGVNPQTFTPTDEAYLKFVHPDDRDMLSSAVQQSFTSGKYECEFRIYRADNQELRYLHAIGEMVTDSHNHQPSHFGVVMDITERKKSEIALMESQRLQAIGEFASGVAHDFNNSLESILGNIEVMLFDPETPENNRQNLLTMKNSVKDASARIKKLQTFGKKGKHKNIFKPIQFNDLIIEVISQTQPIWKDNAEIKGINFTIETELNDIPPIKGNDSELRSALYNLIKNSIEAMPEGGTIRLETRYIADSIYVMIKDTGIGMNDETAQRLFQPFFSTKGFESGRGLGMSGVYSVINDHGGDIWIEQTQVGKGSTIEFSLPIDHEPLQPSSEINQVSANCKDLKVLYIDDIPAINELGKKRIELLGHHADIIDNGEEALKLIDARKYDLIITDIGMQGMNGWQLIDKIYERYGFSIPIAISTGWEMSQLADDIKKHHVNYILNKPVELNDLKNLLNAICKKKNII